MNVTYNNELGIESAFATEMASNVLHARLYCGLKLFDGSKIDESLDIPACVVKWVCRALATLEKEGELLTQTEKDFAATGMARKGAKAATACKKCEQKFCSIWRELHKLA